MQNRRDFITGALATASLAMTGAAVGKEAAKPAFLRSALLHLSHNMWGEYVAPGEKRYPGLKYIDDHVLLVEETWKAVTERMQRRGYNHAVLDIGDAMVFPSHPELAITGSWTADRLRAEIARLKAMGIEAVPKLNFSTGHDGWLKEYGRMISTRKYYEVVKDLINDTCEIFGHPRQFHVGLDEEETLHGKQLPMCIVRRGEFWWHDANYYFECVRKNGAQPICFGVHAYLETGAEMFFRNMPKDVVQNFCLYMSDFDEKDLKRKGEKNVMARRRIQKIAYLREIAKKGYQVIGGTSNWVLKPKDWKPTSPIAGPDYPLNHKSAEGFYGFLRREVPPEQFAGMISMPWEQLTPRRLYCWESGIDELADALDDAKGNADLQNTVMTKEA